MPEGRWGTPEDVGRVVAALLRGDVPYATGTIVHVDGGLTIPSGFDDASAGGSRPQRPRQKQDRSMLRMRGYLVCRVTDAAA